MEVHRELGPGLLEHAYLPCLAYELQNAGAEIDLQQPVTVNYKGIQIACAYRIDLVVDRTVAIEVKTVQELGPIHRAQLMTYLRLGNYPVGLLFNFHSVLMKDGIVRVINGRYRAGDQSQGRAPTAPQGVTDATATKP